MILDIEIDTTTNVLGLDVKVEGTVKIDFECDYIKPLAEILSYSESNLTSPEEDAQANVTDWEFVEDFSLCINDSDFEYNLSTMSFYNKERIKSFIESNLDYTAIEEEIASKYND